MYKNYGDKNFFEYGILIDTEHSNTVFDVLYCRPYSDEEDLFQFAHVSVDIADIDELAGWIETTKVCSFCGLDYDATITTLALIKAKEEYYDGSEHSNISLETFRDTIYPKCESYNPITVVSNEIIDPCQFVIACLEYYGLDSFNPDPYEWRSMNKKEIKKRIRSYLIDYAEVII